MKTARFRTASLLVLVLATSRIAVGQTMVPKLDMEGRRGDVARLAKERALEKFNAADSDKDGRISRSEAEEHLPYFAEKFNERDKNGDGFLSWEEYVGHDRWPR
ncbi:MAG: hypothetical protein D3M94_01370 [Rhodocyclales bacterium GT-UBC]|nr:MAG: hypothetical protein D3M94_01370 [Rhodocyclales bacterium GT-UBC]